LLPAITGTAVTARINRLVNQFLSVDIDGSLLFLTQFSGLGTNMGRKAIPLSQAMSRGFTELCLEPARSPCQILLNTFAGNSFRMFLIQVRQVGDVHWFRNTAEDKIGDHSAGVIKSEEAGIDA
jgi:hypothetical protein